MNPDQSRFYYPYPQPADIPQVQANLDHVQERYDRNPVFPPQHFNWTPAAGQTTTSATFAAIPTSPTWTFYKDESWTDLEFIQNASSYLGGGAAFGGNQTITWGLLLNGVGYPFNSMLFNVTAVHLHSTGMMSLLRAYGAQLGAGRHTAQLGWSVTGAATATVDLGDPFQVRISECLPLPAT